MAQFVDIADYSYDLPDDRIARFPLAKRDESKLLVYQQGQILHRQFYEVSNFLPKNCLLVFNNTKVIPARLHFRKPTGAVIEVFLLHPVEPSNIISQAMEVTGSCTWTCMIGNRKRWKDGAVMAIQLVRLRVGSEALTKAIEFRAEIVDADKNEVRFSWDADISFAEIVKAFGEIPLPPYLKREATDADKQTYQTVYSQNDGAVAAPTAGLHFTDTILNELNTKGFQQEFLTLHVGAGTFQPVKERNVLNHTMHSEQVVYTKANIQALLQNLGNIVAVGTTSMRALESLYWVALTLNSETAKTSFFVEKLSPYQQPKEKLPTPRQALETVLARMESLDIDELIGETEIFIFPGYEFKICKGLITNYHQPGSTLMLLVAAFVGQDWQKIYADALTHEYRFLSYGDSSLLLP